MIHVWNRGVVLLFLTDSSVVWKPALNHVIHYFKPYFPKTQMIRWLLNTSIHYDQTQIFERLFTLVCVVFFLNYWNFPMTLSSERAGIEDGWIMELFGFYSIPYCFIYLDVTLKVIASFVFFEKKRKLKTCSGNCRRLNLSQSITAQLEVK